MAKESVASSPTFEEAMGRLEALVEKMEADKLPLDELLVRYEEGIKLVNLCSEKLTAAEQRIEMIAKNAAGEAELGPLDLPQNEEPSKPEKKRVSLS